MTYPADHPIGCICPACENAWEECEVDVCQKCGAYFEWQKGQRFQRCFACSAGLNGPWQEEE